MRYEGSVRYVKRMPSSPPPSSILPPPPVPFQSNPRPLLPNLDAAGSSSIASVKSREGSDTPPDTHTCHRSRRGESVAGLVGVASTDNGRVTVIDAGDSMLLTAPSSASTVMLYDNVYVTVWEKVGSAAATWMHQPGGRGW